LTHDPKLDAAYALCRQIAKREAKNFYYAFVALPKPRRNAICAIYAFMRQADDLADDESLSREERCRRLDSWLAQWRAVCERPLSATPVTADPVFHPRMVTPPLERLAALSELEFRDLFASTPVSRARYTGFLRNVAVAMGNRALPQFRPALEKLARSEDAVVAEHAQWALGRLAQSG